MYSEQQAEAEAAGGEQPGGEAEAQAGDDASADAVDAEFEEVKDNK